jgi:phosphoglycolate phosphatase-like HAD superfamily hydrolase
MILRSSSRTLAATAVLVWRILLDPAGALAQPAPAAGQALDRPGVPPAEIQRMFDAYALVQAQDQLKLTDDKYPQFLVKFKALQDVRRRTQQERNRLLQELRRLANEGGDEGLLKEQLHALQDLEARARADVQKAYEGVDSVLDVRQQAKFRLFEEQMERRKIELLMRARQANRQQKRNQ